MARHSTDPLRPWTLCTRPFASQQQTGSSWLRRAATELATGLSRRPIWMLGSTRQDYMCSGVTPTNRSATPINRSVTPTNSLGIRARSWLLRPRRVGHTAAWAMPATVHESTVSAGVRTYTRQVRIGPAPRIYTRGTSVAHPPRQPSWPVQLWCFREFVKQTGSLGSALMRCGPDSVTRRRTLLRTARKKRRLE